MNYRSVAGEDLERLLEMLEGFNIPSKWEFDPEEKAFYTTISGEKNYIDFEPEDEETKAVLAVLNNLPMLVEAVRGRYHFLTWRGNDGKDKEE